MTEIPSLPVPATQQGPTDWSSQDLDNAERCRHHGKLTSLRFRPIGLDPEGFDQCLKSIVQLPKDGKSVNGQANAQAQSTSESSIANGHEGEQEGGRRNIVPGANGRNGNGVKKMNGQAIECERSKEGVHPQRFLKQVQNAMSDLSQKVEGAGIDNSGSGSLSPFSFFNRYLLPSIRGRPSGIGGGVGAVRRFGRPI